MTDRNHKKFGITVSLPANDPMAADHLLGENWTGERWFSTEEERDDAYESMSSHPRYYRTGDKPSAILRKIEA